MNWLIFNTIVVWNNRLIHFFWKTLNETYSSWVWGDEFSISGQRWVDASGKQNLGMSGVKEKKNKIKPGVVLERRGNKLWDEEKKEECLWDPPNIFFDHAVTKSCMRVSGVATFWGRGQAETEGNLGQCLTEENTEPWDVSLKPEESQDKYQSAEMK